MSNPYLFRARVKGTKQVIAFFSEKARREWIARDPENRERVLRPSNRSRLPEPSFPLFENLPPYGQRVKGLLASGIWIKVYRRRGPVPPGWVWATDHDHANIKRSAILKWEPLDDL